MAEIAKYLLPSERHALEVRHHWAALSGYAGTAIAFWAGGLLALYLFIDVALLRATFVFFLLFTVGWFLWMVGEWYLERFVVTDRRVLLLTGILTKRVAIMPLAKVTDLTYERTIIGRLLGYGVFVIESAGQQQALSRIAYIPHPDQLYQEVSGLLFGSQSGSDDGTGSTGGNAAGGNGPDSPPQPPRPPSPPSPPGPPGPHGPPHPELPPDPSGPDGPRGDLWSPTGVEPEQQPYQPKRYATQPLDDLPLDQQPYDQPPYAPRPYVPQPYDEQAWELPQPSEHRANAPTAPLPSVR